MEDAPAVRLEELEARLRSAREGADTAEALLRLGLELSEVRSLRQTLNLVMAIVPGLFEADRGFIVAREGARDRFSVMASRGYDSDQLARLEELAEMEGGLPLMAEALRTREVLMLSDVASSGRLGADAARERGTGALVGIPLLRQLEVVGGLMLEFDSPRPFGERERELARGVASHVGAAVANARRFTLLAGLRSFGLSVGSGQRLRPVINAVRRGALELLGGDESDVLLAGERGDVLVSVGGGRHTPLDPRRPPWTALEDESPILLAGREGDEFPRCAAIRIPSTSGGLLGALLVFFRRPVELTADELEAFQVAAAQAGISIEHAQRFERQRRVIRSLQRGLVDLELPRLEGCELGAVYEPADTEADIGGDFFDAFEIDDHLGLVVGDVSGKGAEAAAQTAIAKYMLRAFAMRSHRPAPVLFDLNNALVRGMGEDRFATVVYATYDLRSGLCEVAVGGHPPPLLYRAERGTVETLAPGGSLLGAFVDQSYSTQSVRLRPGDALVAFTDGLVEARRGSELYGRERVVRSIRSHAGSVTAAELARAVYDDAGSFGEVMDDTVVLALIRRGDRG